MYLMKSETVAKSLRSYYSVNYIKKEWTSYEACLLVHKTEKQNGTNKGTHKSNDGWPSNLVSVHCLNVFLL